MDIKTATIMTQRLIADDLSTVQELLSETAQRRRNTAPTIFHCKMVYDASVPPYNYQSYLLTTLRSKL